MEVKLGTSVVVTLTDGTAEIFGAELPKGTPVDLPGGKHAIFSWHGATIEMLGEPEHCYVAGETPMVEYANVEGVMEARRREAAASDGAGPSGGEGPRVALVGPTDVGKSTLSKIMCNYAVRKGWNPLLRRPRPRPRRHHVPRHRRRRSHRPTHRRRRRTAPRDASRVLPRRRQPRKQPGLVQISRRARRRRCSTLGTAPTPPRAPPAWWSTPWDGWTALDTNCCCTRWTR